MKLNISILERKNFFLFLLVACFACQTVLGYEGVYLFIFTLILLIYFLSRKALSFCESTALVTTFLLLFDAPPFTFTDANIRIWYFLFLPVLCVQFFRNDFFVAKRLSKKIFMPVFAMLMVAGFWFVLDPMNGKVSNLKYLIFSFGLLLFLISSYKSIAQKLGSSFLFRFFLNLITFVCIYGFLQFFFILAIRGLSSRYIHEVAVWRPCGFFSETTWYGEFMVFGVILAVYEHRKTSDVFYVLISFLFLIGIILSATRNAIFGILLVFLGYLFFVFLSGRFHRTKFKLSNIFLLLIVIACCGVFIAKNIKILETLLDSYSYIVRKFTEGDASSKGRFLMVTESIERIKQSIVIGHGFSFNDATDYVGVGTAIGAKNANVLLMIFYIFGLLGFIPFCFLILYYFLSVFQIISVTNSDLAKVSALFMLVFFAIAMTAPIHQYPLGMWCVSTSLWLFHSRKTKSGQDTALIS